ncbi:MAG TPA: CoA-transferase [Polyangiaceae bacterium]|jgi:glutaconate CoA-transferase subunit A
MADKRMTPEAVVAELRDGMTIGIGGWGARRKPMALVRAVLRSSLRDLTVVTFGGPDLGMLCAAGKVKRAIYGFASLDSIPIEPYFRAARQAGTIEASEIDEGMLQWGLYAAALRLPFLPTRAGLGSDALALNPWLRTVRSPYDDGEELVAMPALELDAALVHVHRADASGNTQILGPDPYFDDLYCMAAKRRYVSCERVVRTDDLAREGSLQTMRLHRSMVDGIIEAPRGAAFTSCEPDYGRDEEMQRAYAASASEPGGWKAFSSRFVEGGGT